MTEIVPDLAPLAWVYCLIATALAAALQRISGQGFGMLSAPLIALVAPEMLPTTLLILGALVGYRAMRADRSAVTLSELPPGLLGRLVGAILAAWLASALIGSGSLGVVIALVVFAAIGLSLLGVRVAISPGSLFGAGLAAGLMGTLTAIGAPPMALLYQYEERARAAAMQNTFFMCGMVFSFSALLWHGLVRTDHFGFALALTPAVFAGLQLAGPFNRVLGTIPARAVALGLAGASASLLLLRSLATG